MPFYCRMRIISLQIGLSYDVSSASKIYMPLSHYCYIKSKLNHHQPFHQLLCTATPQHNFQITYMMIFSTLILQWWLLSPTFPIHWFCCIARIITLLSYDECAASPLHRNTPIQHITSCILSIHIILLFLRVVGAMDCLIGYVTFPRCCYYLSLEAESYALMTVWKNIPPPLWQKTYTSRRRSKPHCNCRLPLLLIDVVILPSHQVGCADIMTK